MRKDERGYVIVETMGTFILFVFLMVSILSLVNIAALRAKVHHAITQAAQTLSVYSYVLETDIAGAPADIDDFSAELIALLLNDPESAARPLVGRYLHAGDTDGDGYLKRMNVEGGLNGLDFDGFVYSGGDITITISYKVAYSFGALPLPFPALSVTQSVKTRSWANGKGERYIP